jgi:hypothetical protein
MQPRGGRAVALLHGRPPPSLALDVDTCSGLRDRALLLVGFAVDSRSQWRDQRYTGLGASLRAVAELLQRQRGRGPGHHERDLAHAVLVVEVHAEARVDELGEREAPRARQAHR